MIQGVQIDLISSERLENLTSLEKIRMILEKVIDGKPDSFAGSEMETYSS